MSDTNTTLTYVESKGKPAFDWNDFLKRAEAGTVKPAEWQDANGLAIDWITCACGNQCAVLPRNPYGCPKDEKLILLGSDFMDLIRAGMNGHDMDETIRDAKECLRRIEARSAYLLTLPGYTDPDDE